jgi:hypothetical protein
VSGLPVFGSSGLLAIALLFTACSAASEPPAYLTATFICADNRSFTVARNAEVATVFFDGAQYRLARRASSIGIKYASSDASLIVDGDFAAFVTEAVPDLDDCRIKPTIAA